MFFTLKSSILVISGYLRTVQVAPGHPVMPCESLGKSLQTCLSQDKSGFPDGHMVLLPVAQSHGLATSSMVTCSCWHLPCLQWPSYTSDLSVTSLSLIIYFEFIKASFL
jgi:hypothetical protein